MRESFEDLMEYDKLCLISGRRQKKELGNDVDLRRQVGGGSIQEKDHQA